MGIGENGQHGLVVVRHVKVVFEHETGLAIILVLLVVVWNVWCPTVRGSYLKMKYKDVQSIHVKVT